MTSQPRYGTWWRRVADYTLRMVIPTSMLSQLAGTIIMGRSHPDGRVGTLITAGSFLVITAISGLTASPGQTWTHRLMGLHVRSTANGRPARAWRLAIRDLAHLADWAILGLGFALPLLDPHGRTLADMITGTTVTRTPPHAPTEEHDGSFPKPEQGHAYIHEPPPCSHLIGAIMRGQENTRSARLRDWIEHEEALHL